MRSHVIVPPGSKYAPFLPDLVPLVCLNDDPDDPVWSWDELNLSYCDDNHHLYPRRDADGRTLPPATSIKPPPNKSRTAKGNGGSLFLNWTIWSTWTRCNPHCGPGKRTRTRLCLNEKGCDGAADQTEACETYCHPESGGNPFMPLKGTKQDPEDESEYEDWEKIMIGLIQAQVGVIIFVAVVFAGLRLRRCYYGDKDQLKEQLKLGDTPSINVFSAANSQHGLGRSVLPNDAHLNTEYWMDVAEDYAQKALPPLPTNEQQQQQQVAFQQPQLAAVQQQEALTARQSEASPTQKMNPVQQTYDQGYTNQGYTDQGYTEQGYTEPIYMNPGYMDPSQQGYTNQGYADQGYTDQGYTDQGYTDQGYTDQGYTDQGYTEPVYIDPSQLNYMGESQQGYTDQTQQGYIDQTQQGYIDQSQQGYTDQSQQGYIDQTQQGYIDQSQQGYTDQSQQGYTDQSQQGYIDQSQQGYMDQSQQGYTEPAQEDHYEQLIDDDNNYQNVNDFRGDGAALQTLNQQPTPQPQNVEVRQQQPISEDRRIEPIQKQESLARNKEPIKQQESIARNTNPTAGIPKTQSTKSDKNRGFEPIPITKSKGRKEGYGDDDIYENVSDVVQGGIGKQPSAARTPAPNIVNVIQKEPSRSSAPRSIPKESSATQSRPAGDDRRTTQKQESLERNKEPIKQQEIIARNTKTTAGIPKTQSTKSDKNRGFEPIPITKSKGRKEGYGDDDIYENGPGQPSAARTPAPNTVSVIQKEPSRSSAPRSIPKKSSATRSRPAGDDRRTTQKQESLARNKEPIRQQESIARNTKPAAILKTQSTKSDKKRGFEPIPITKSKGRKEGYGDDDIYENVSDVVQGGIGKQPSAARTPAPNTVSVIQKEPSRSSAPRSIPKESSATRSRPAGDDRRRDTPATGHVSTTQSKTADKYGRDAGIPKAQSKSKSKNDPTPPSTSRAQKPGRDPDITKQIPKESSKVSKGYRDHTKPVAVPVQNSKIKKPLDNVVKNMADEYGNIQEVNSTPPSTKPPKKGAPTSPSTKQPKINAPSSHDDYEDINNVLVASTPKKSFSKNINALSKLNTALAAGIGNYERLQMDGGSQTNLENINPAPMRRPSRLSTSGGGGGDDYETFDGDADGDYETLNESIPPPKPKHTKQPKQPYNSAALFSRPPPTVKEIKAVKAAAASGQPTSQLNESNYDTPYSPAVMFGGPPPTVAQIKAMKASGQGAAAGGGIYGELAQKIGQRTPTKQGSSGIGSGPATPSAQPPINRDNKNKKKKKKRKDGRDDTSENEDTDHERDNDDHDDDNNRPGNNRRGGGGGGAGGAGGNQGNRRGGGGSGGGNDRGGYGGGGGRGSGGRGGQQPDDTLYEEPNGHYEHLSTFIDPNGQPINLTGPPTDPVNANVDEQTTHFGDTLNVGMYLSAGRPPSAPSTIPNETSDEDRKRSLSQSDSLESISSHEESLPRTNNSKSDIPSHQGSLYSSLDVNTSFQSRDGRTSPLPSLDAMALKEVCKSFGSLQRTIEEHMANGLASSFQHVGSLKNVPKNSLQELKQTNETIYQGLVEMLSDRDLHLCLKDKTQYHDFMQTLHGYYEYLSVQNPGLATKLQATISMILTGENEHQFDSEPESESFDNRTTIPIGYFPIIGDNGHCYFTNADGKLLTNKTGELVTQRFNNVSNNRPYDNVQDVIDNGGLHGPTKSKAKETTDVVLSPFKGPPDKSRVNKNIILDVEAPTSNISLIQNSLYAKSDTECCSEDAKKMTKDGTATAISKQVSGAKPLVKEESSIPTKQKKTPLNQLDMEARKALLMSPNKMSESTYTNPINPENSLAAKMVAESSAAGNQYKPLPKKRQDSDSDWSHDSDHEVTDQAFNPISLGLGDSPLFKKRTESDRDQDASKRNPVYENLKKPDYGDYDTRIIAPQAKKISNHISMAFQSTYLYRKRRAESSDEEFGKSDSFSSSDRGSSISSLEQENTYKNKSTLQKSADIHKTLGELRESSNELQQSLGELRENTRELRQHIGELNQSAGELSDHSNTDDYSAPPRPDAQKPGQYTSLKAKKDNQFTMGIENSPLFKKQAGNYEEIDQPSKSNINLNPDISTSVKRKSSTNVIPTPLPRKPVVSNTNLSPVPARRTPSISVPELPARKPNASNTNLPVIPARNLSTSITNLSPTLPPRNIGTTLGQKPSTNLMSALPSRLPSSSHGLAQAILATTQKSVNILSPVPSPRKPSSNTELSGPAIPERKTSGEIYTCVSEIPDGYFPFIGEDGQCYFIDPEGQFLTDSSGQRVKQGFGDDSSSATSKKASKVSLSQLVEETAPYEPLSKHDLDAVRKSSSSSFEISSDDGQISSVGSTSNPEDDYEPPTTPEKRLPNAYAKLASPQQKALNPMSMGIQNSPLFKKRQDAEYSNLQEPYSPVAPVRKPSGHTQKSSTNLSLNKDEVSKSRTNLSPVAPVRKPSGHTQKSSTNLSLNKDEVSKSRTNLSPVAPIRKPSGHKQMSSTNLSLNKDDVTKSKTNLSPVAPVRKPSSHTQKSFTNLSLNRDEVSKSKTNLSPVAPVRKPSGHTQKSFTNLSLNRDEVSKSKTNLSPVAPVRKPSSHTQKSFTNLSLNKDEVSKSKINLSPIAPGRKLSSHKQKSSASLNPLTLDKTTPSRTSEPEPEPEEPQFSFKPSRIGGFNPLAPPMDGNPYSPVKSNAANPLTAGIGESPLFKKRQTAANDGQEGEYSNLSPTAPTRKFSNQAVDSSTKPLAAPIPAPRAKPVAPPRRQKPAGVIFDNPDTEVDPICQNIDTATMNDKTSESENIYENINELKTKPTTGKGSSNISLSIPTRAERSSDTKISSRKSVRFASDTCDNDDRPDPEDSADSDVEDVFELKNVRFTASTLNVGPSEKTNEKIRNRKITRFEKPKLDDEEHVHFTDDTVDNSDTEKRNEKIKNRKVTRFEKPKLDDEEHVHFTDDTVDNSDTEKKNEKIKNRKATRYQKPDLTNSKDEYTNLRFGQGTVDNSETEKTNEKIKNRKVTRYEKPDLANSKDEYANLRFGQGTVDNSETEKTNEKIKNRKVTRYEKPDLTNSKDEYTNLRFGQDTLDNSETEKTNEKIKNRKVTRYEKPDFASSEGEFTNLRFGQGTVDNSETEKTNEKIKNRKVTRFEPAIYENLDEEDEEGVIATANVRFAEDVVDNSDISLDSKSSCRKKSVFRRPSEIDSLSESEPVVSSISSDSETDSPSAQKDPIYDNIQPITKMESEVSKFKPKPTPPGGPRRLHHNNSSIDHSLNQMKGRNAIKLPSLYSSPSKEVALPPVPKPVTRSRSPATTGEAARTPPPPIAASRSPPPVGRKPPPVGRKPTAATKKPTQGTPADTSNLKPADNLYLNITVPSSTRLQTGSPDELASKRSSAVMRKYPYPREADPAMDDSNQQPAPLPPIQTEQSGFARHPPRRQPPTPPTEPKKPPNKYVDSPRPSYEKLEPQPPEAESKKKPTSTVLDMEQGPANLQSPSLPPRLGVGSQHRPSPRPSHMGPSLTTSDASTIVHSQQSTPESSDESFYKAFGGGSNLPTGEQLQDNLLFCMTEKPFTIEEKIQMMGTGSSIGQQVFHQGGSDESNNSFSSSGSGSENDFPKNLRHLKRYSAILKSSSRYPNPSRLYGNDQAIPQHQSTIPANQSSYGQAIPQHQSTIPANQSSYGQAIPQHQSRIPANQSGIPATQSGYGRRASKSADKYKDVQSRVDQRRVEIQEAMQVHRRISIVPSGLSHEEGVPQEMSRVIPPQISINDGRQPAINPEISVTKYGQSQESPMIQPQISVTRSGRQYKEPVTQPGIPKEGSLTIPIDSSLIGANERQRPPHGPTGPMKQRRVSHVIPKEGSLTIPMESSLIGTDERHRPPLGPTGPIKQRRVSHVIPKEGSLTIPMDSSLIGADERHRPPLGPTGPMKQRRVSYAIPQEDSLAIPVDQSLIGDERRMPVPMPYRNRALSSSRDVEKSGLSAWKAANFAIRYTHRSKARKGRSNNPYGTRRNSYRPTPKPAPRDPLTVNLNAEMQGVMTRRQSRAAAVRRLSQIQQQYPQGNTGPMTELQKIQREVSQAIAAQQSTLRDPTQMQASRLGYGHVQPQLSTRLAPVEAEPIQQQISTRLSPAVQADQDLAALTEYRRKSVTEKDTQFQNAKRRLFTEASNFQAPVPPTAPPLGISALKDDVKSHIQSVTARNRELIGKQVSMAEQPAPPQRRKLSESFKHKKEGVNNLINRFNVTIEEEGSRPPAPPPKSKKPVPPPATTRKPQIPTKVRPPPKPLAPKPAPSTAPKPGPKPRPQPRPR
ncbi:uncharacterized protein [Clytia hemisphaerica]|uniref:uncharacterized protein n=1 Tax=Clytia hemisphaerica TaxID=252671 RepID=UPI0034D6B3A5